MTTAAPALWHVSLFGSLHVTGPSGTRPPIARFRTQRTAGLLAFLAFHNGLLHSREVLAEMLWPGIDPQTGRTRLKQEIATLRRPLESGLAPGSVLQTDGHSHIGFVPGAVSTDADAFGALLRHAAAPTLSPQEVVGFLHQAVALHGDAGFLPGRYDEWVSDQRERLRLLYANALQRIAGVPAIGGEAWDAARRAIQAAPFDEASHAALIRLHLAEGNVAAARAQFAHWERIAEDSGEDAPSTQLRRLVEAAAPPPFPSAAVPLPVAPVPAAVENAPFGVLPARLPSLLTPFFDRAKEINAVLAALYPASRDEDRARLITLTGSGGMGKTRLALQIAHRVANGKTGPPFVVAFAPLAGVTDAALLWEAVLSAVFPHAQTEIAPNIGQSAKARLIGLFQKCQTAGSNGGILLLLDNLEQIAEEAAPLILQFLHDAPWVSCLVTSRQRLHAGGEREIPVPPLPLLSLQESDGGMPIIPPSVLFFADRARAARPDFALNERSTPLVGEICALLDGIPLSLELAAARVSVLGLAPLRDALKAKKLDTLQSRRRDLPTRHRTLRDTIAWSFDLLPPDARQIFVRLSVFRSGWTLDAARAVGEISTEADALHLLEVLHDHSLITSLEHAATGEMRFAMLQTLREWAEEQMTPKEQNANFERVVRFYLDMTARADLEIRGEHEAYWLARLDAEHDNLRAALDWAINDAAQNQLRPDDDPLRDAALRLCDEVAQYWWLKGHLHEARRWYKDAINASSRHDAPRAVLSDALRSCASLIHNQDDNDEARELTLRALHIAQAIKHRRCEAYAHGTLGRIALNCGDFQTACEHLEQGMVLFGLYESKPDYIQNMEAIQRHNLGIARLSLGDHSTARNCFEETMAYWRSRGMVHRSQIADSLEALGELEWLAGRPQAALPLLQEAETIRRNMGVKGGLSQLLLIMGRVHHALGDARPFLRESLRLAHETGHRLGMVEALEEIAVSETVHHRLEAAAQLWGMAAALRDHPSPLPVSVHYAKPQEAARIRVKSELGPTQWAACGAEGRSVVLSGGDFLQVAFGYFDGEK